MGPSDTVIVLPWGPSNRLTTNYRGMTCVLRRGVMKKERYELNTSSFLTVISKDCCLPWLKDLQRAAVVGPKPQVDA